MVPWGSCRKYKKAYSFTLQFDIWTRFLRLFKNGEHILGVKTIMKEREISRKERAYEIAKFPLPGITRGTNTQMCKAEGEGETDTNKLHLNRFLNS